MFAALTDEAGVVAHRAGALERVALLLAERVHAQHRLTDTDTRMLSALEELKLTHLALSITGLRPGVGQACWAGAAGETVRQLQGPRKITGQGRPGLRLAAWRAVWAAQRSNPVYAARYRHLTTRDTAKVRPTRAQTVLAATILRHLHAVAATGAGCRRV